MKYWKWFFFKGYKSIANRWLVLHLFVGILLGFLSNNNLNDIAIAVIFPASGMLLSVCMAWSGAFTALINSKEIIILKSKIKEVDKDVRYIYNYQTSVLILLITATAWAIIAIIGDSIKIAIIYHCYYEEQTFLIIKTALFTMSSIAIRETWGITNYANALQVAKTKIADINEKKQE